MKEVHELVMKSTGQVIDPLYFNTTVDLMRKKIEGTTKIMFTEDAMDLPAFLVLTNLLKSWYDIGIIDMAEFIERKFRDKYTVTSADILGLISKAVAEASNEKATSEPRKARRGRPRKDLDAAEKDMYKIVQTALNNGMTRTAIKNKYNLNQADIVRYGGAKYWNDEQRKDHDKMLEYRRLHPACSNKEAIEKGCGKASAGYRFALVPTAEQQDAYNAKFAEKGVVKEVPKATIKGDFKSLMLTDAEKKEQQALYEMIKEYAASKRISPREATTELKTRLKRDYGIVIDQIKKDLMIKYNVNRGEGKAPNALEAIVMSEYLSVAKSVLETMVEESGKVV